jgi:hypothetical protein
MRVHVVTKDTGIESGRRTRGEGNIRKRTKENSNDEDAKEGEGEKIQDRVLTSIACSSSSA